MIKQKHQKKKERMKKRIPELFTFILDYLFLLYFHFFGFVG